MAYGQNVVGDISTYIQTIYEMANIVARDNNFATSLVTNFNDNAGTAARTRSEYGTVNFAQITDADDLASQVFKPTTDSTITPAFFGAQFFLTDRRMRSDAMQVMREASNELGYGAAKHVQLALLGNFSSLTGGTAGSAGGTATWATLFKAVSLLRQQNAPGPYYGVLHEGHWFHLGTAVIPAGAQTNGVEMQNSVLANYFVGRFFGVDWFVTNDIASGTAAVGGVFSREAMGYDQRKNFGIEAQRDSSRGGGGFELNATMEYAEGVWRPKFGSQIIGTTVIP
jgi:hypothetical protein